jgi:hypothetical protein
MKIVNAIYKKPVTKDPVGSVAFVIMLFLPFPVDLAVALLAFLALTWYKRNQLLRKLGMEKAKSKDKGF